MYKNKYSNKIEYKNAEQYKKSKIKHVIVFGIDGLGGYVFKKPNHEKKFFSKILKDSFYTFEGRNVFPTETGQNWSTIFTGSSVSQHGYTNWFSDYPEIPPVICTEYNRYPTIFYLIRTQIKGAKIASFCTWPGMSKLYEHQIFDKDDNLPSDKETVDAAIKYFLKERPVIMNITLEEVDLAGHKKGHNTKEYYEKVKEAEKYFYKVVDALKQKNLLEQTLIVICSDHGGFNKGHAPNCASDREELTKLYHQAVEVPIIFYNPTITTKYESPKQIFNWDIAPTIASIFGLKVPEMWIGKKINELF